MSDWSSDVCSSDLPPHAPLAIRAAAADPRAAVRSPGRVAGSRSPAPDRLPRPGLGTGLPGVPPQQSHRADPQPLAGPRTDPPALLGALAAPRRQPAGVRPGLVPRHRPGAHRLIRPFLAGPQIPECAPIGEGSLFPALLSARSERHTTELHSLMRIYSA